MESNDLISHLLKKATGDYYPGGLVRRDRRCGADFPLPGGGGGNPFGIPFAICDPSAENHCCSKWGYCGADADHCSCDECVDYR